MGNKWNDNSGSLVQRVFWKNKINKVFSDLGQVGFGKAKLLNYNGK